MGWKIERDAATGTTEWKLTNLTFIDSKIT